MNYAVNVQFILAVFYIGHSGKTLDFLMGSLDLPNAQTMHQHYYQNADEVAMIIIRVARRRMEEAMEQEIIAAYSLETGREESYKTLFKKDGTIHENLPSIGISVGYDTEWQKHCGRHRYDSLSGHGLFLGLQMNFVICYVCYYKHYKICDCVRKEGGVIHVHNCPTKYEGRSSESMEADGALKLLKEIYKKL